MLNQNTTKNTHVIKPKWLDYNTDLRPVAESIAKEHFKKNGGLVEFPIEPEIILGNHFKVDVVPEFLPRTTGVRAALTPTLNTVYIDEGLYMNNAAQHIVRQTLAHEMGHIIYHRSIIVNADIATPRDAFTFHQSFTAATHSQIEIQANIFAGALLVPHEYLLAKVAKLLFDNYELYRYETMPISKLVHALGGTKLAKTFGVSDQVISWRLETMKVYELLDVQPTDSIDKLDLDRLAKLAYVEPALSPTPVHPLLQALGFVSSR